MELCWGRPLPFQATFEYRILDAVGFNLMSITKHVWYGESLDHLENLVIRELSHLTRLDDIVKSDIKGCRFNPCDVKKRKTLSGIFLCDDKEVRFDIVSGREFNLLE